MLQQGAVLLVAGMLIVMLFLLLMIGVMSLLAVIVPKFNHILPDPEPKKIAKKSSNVSNDDEAVAAAIAVALSSK